MKKIFIITGEASGDKHAARFVTRLNNMNSDLYFYGVGGPAMCKAGVDILFDNNDMAVVGLLEILKHYKVIMSAFKTVKKSLRENKPDLLILIDYPGFNLKIAKFAKQLNIKILYYISPQLWAWHKNRIRIIQECVDTMAVILPFEVDFYKEHHVKAYYVGHPLSQIVKPTLTRDEAYQIFGLEKNRLIIGLIAGSRKSEIKYIFPTILKTALLLVQRYPNVQFVLPLAAQLDKTLIHSYLKKYALPIKIIEHNLYNALQLCDAAICVSGTVTLEVAMSGVPFIIIYRFAFITALLAFFLVDVKYIGLANIVAQEAVAKELIQYQANPKAIAAEIILLLEDKNYRKKIRQSLHKLRSIMDQHQSQNLLEPLILQMLNPPLSQNPLPASETVSNAWV